MKTCYGILNSGFRVGIAPECFRVSFYVTANIYFFLVPKTFNQIFNLVSRPTQLCAIYIHIPNYHENTHAEIKKQTLALSDILDKFEINRLGKLMFRTVVNSLFPRRTDGQTSRVMT